MENTENMGNGTRSGYYTWADSEPSAHEVQDIGTENGSAWRSSFTLSDFASWPTWLPEAPTCRTGAKAHREG